MKNFISVVIAAYNERENIKILTPAIDKAFKKAGLAYELIYVIDGNDGSDKLLKILSKENPNIRFFHSERPQGFGNAFRKGFSMISDKASLVLTMDADLNHRPQDLPIFLEKQKEGDFDILVGSRRVIGSEIIDLPKYKDIVSRIATFVLNTLFRIRIKDMSSGYRLYKKDVIQKLYKRARTNNFEFLPELLLIANTQKLKMAEVPIVFTMRIHGESKLQWIRTAMGYLRLLKRY